MCSKSRLSMSIGDAQYVDCLYSTALSKIPGSVLRLLSISWNATFHRKKADLIRSLIRCLRSKSTTELREQSEFILDSRQNDLLRQLFDLRQLEGKFEQGEIPSGTPIGTKLLFIQDIPQPKRALLSPQLTVQILGYEKVYQYYRDRIEETSRCTRLHVIHAFLRAFDPDRKISHPYPRESGASKPPIWWPPRVPYRKLTQQLDRDLNELLLYILCGLYDCGIRVEHLEAAIQGLSISAGDNLRLQNLIHIRAQEERFLSPPELPMANSHARIQARNPVWTRLGLLPRPISMV